MGLFTVPSQVKIPINMEFKEIFKEAIKTGVTMIIMTWMMLVMNKLRQEMTIRLRRETVILSNTVAFIKIATIQESIIEEVADCVATFGVNNTPFYMS